jgi:hypothetical protein
MNLASHFTWTFREEHRVVRDLLLELVDAFDRRDIPRVRALLADTAAYVGPHFRYEEESLYPGLVRIFGADYIEKLLADHDRAIGTAQALVGLAGQEGLSERDAALGVRYVRSILPHVSDCDGLSIMVERFPEGEVQAIFDAREQALRESLDLLTWAGTLRRRAPILPEAF